eukprot:TRINITY_DN579_c1_g1_i1.p7 TRINITY_DN579_c1_g1~~TRINITY_DN579_c1_g1_i1.p7  ORF type:complete len:111 (+),score=4.62 TRINITY_DN579_c1_g1_i1:879-1211(+)
MSSDKTGEKPVRRKPKVSWARLILPGLVGSQAEAYGRRRWEAGQYSCTTELVKKPVRTEKGRGAGCWLCPAQASRGVSYDQKARQLSSRCDESVKLRLRANSPVPRFQEK